MAEKASRRVPDPAVAVRDLESCIETFVREEGNRDLTKLLADLKDVTYRTAATGSLSKVAVLFNGVFKLCPNGCLPIKKLELALAKVDKQNKINYTKVSTEPWSVQTGLVLRAIASKFRNLKDSKVKWDRCMKKVGTWESE